MIFHTDGNGNTTQITYNTLGGITSKSVPLSIDTSGKITYNIVRYSYDNAGNVSSEYVSGGPTTTYTYDHMNRVVKAVTGSEAVSYTYDGLHRKLSESAVKNGITSKNTFAYSTVGGITSLSNSSGTKNYTYNSSGLAASEETNRTLLSRLSASQ